MADLVGKTLGAYRIDSPLGVGGMGEVYRATHVLLNRPAAIKVLHANQAVDPTFQARFLREARAAAALSHPNIVEVFDFGEQDGSSFLVMELVPDGSLRTLLRQRAAGEGWTLGLGVDLVRQAAEGLAYAHVQGMVHRDIKPDNLLLLRRAWPTTPVGQQPSAPGEQFTLKISDFGLARLIEESSELTATGMVMGTPTYMSPEQCQGADLDGRSDLYSLGVVLYEVATGAPPFRAKSLSEAVFKHISASPVPPRQIRPDLPSALDEVIMRCLMKRPDDRFPTGAALAAALDGALHETEERTIITTPGPGALITPTPAAPSSDDAATVAASTPPAPAATPPTPVSSPQLGPALGPALIGSDEANTNMTVRATPATPATPLPAASARQSNRPRVAAATAPRWDSAEDDLATVASGPTHRGGAAGPPTQPRTRAVVAGVLALALILVVGLVARSAFSGKTRNNAKGSVTATATPRPTPTPVEAVVYQNSLATYTSSWPTSSHSYFTDGGYELNGAWIAYSPAPSFSDGSISVRTRQVSGPSDQFYGILFRAHGDNDYYFFGISQNQQWTFSLVSHGNGIPLLPPTADSHINTALNTSNTLTVRATGSHFVFYINGAQVGQKDDATLSAGQIGLVNAIGHLVVIYNDFTVKTPAA